jgi:hypothetical protein
MQEKAENKTVIRNALLINEESMKADVMIAGDRIAGIFPPGRLLQAPGQR